MNEDVLNIEIRKFLKQVGVTSQRAIETTLRAADAAGQLKGRSRVTAKVVLTIDGFDLRHEVVADIAFD